MELGVERDGCGLESPLVEPAGGLAEQLPAHAREATEALAARVDAELVPGPDPPEGVGQEDHPTCVLGPVVASRVP